MTEKELIGTSQAAKIAGRHQRTVVSWIRKGLLPAKKLPGARGPYIIDPDDLQVLLIELYTPRPYRPQDEHGSEQ